MENIAQSTRVGIVGFGRMGSALLERLAGQGCEVCGWNRTPLDAVAVQKTGGRIFSDLADLAANSDIIMLALFDDKAVDNMVRALCTHDLNGKLIVDTSTTRPQTIRGLVGLINAAGACAVDSPIAGGPDMVLAGKISLFVGGQDVDVDRFRSVADALAGRVLHVGGLGAGATAKVFNNMMLCGYWQVLKEAMQTGQAGGLSFDLMLEILAGSPAASPAFIGRIPIFKGENDVVGFSVNGVLKDAELFADVAQSLGVEIAAIQAVLESFRETKALGLGEADLAEMVRSALGQSDGR